MLSGPSTRARAKKMHVDQAGSIAILPALATIDVALLLRPFALQKQ
jgi:hypothetical protein